LQVPRLHLGDHEIKSVYDKSQELKVVNSTMALPRFQEQLEPPNQYGGAKQMALSE
jgi:hypothetical protein